MGNKNSRFTNETVEKGHRRDYHSSLKLPHLHLVSLLGLFPDCNLIKCSEIIIDQTDKHFYFLLLWFYISTEVFDQEHKL